VLIGDVINILAKERTTLNPTYKGMQGSSGIDVGWVLLPRPNIFLGKENSYSFCLLPPS